MRKTFRIIPKKYLLKKKKRLKSYRFPTPYVYKKRKLSYYKHRKFRRKIRRKLFQQKRSQVKKLRNMFTKLFSTKKQIQKRNPYKRKIFKSTKKNKK